METVDIEAKTIDDAIAKACRQFQTTRDKLNIEILAEGNAGFLGFGSKKAHIRAGILDIDQELDHLINGNDKSPSLTVKASPQTATADISQGNPAVAKEERGKSAKRRGNEQKSKSNPVEGPHNQKQKKTVKQNTDETHAEPTPSGQTEGIKALELVEGILTRMNIPARVSMEEESDAVIVKITGDGDGLLIGKRGQNLDALQYLVNKAIHHTRNDSKRIVIDTEEYRKRRENTLQSTALQVAQKVRKTRKPMTLGPMNPHDRRIIHIALKNEKSLTTKSRGEGEFRKVVIAPAQRGAIEEPSEKNP
jgi:spoIIIJ-associated protein